MQFATAALSVFAAMGAIAIPLNSTNALETQGAMNMFITYPGVSRHQHLYAKQLILTCVLLRPEMHPEDADMQIPGPEWTDNYCQMP